eukprot:gene132-743_t
MERKPLLSESSNEERYDGADDSSSINIDVKNDSFLLQQQDHDEAQIFEDAISSTGFGKFHIMLLFVCGWALASDSVEIQAVSFVLPSACDLKLTSAEKGWLNAIIFVGMMVGGYSLGGMADIKGRRFVLLWSMTINGLFALASSFANEFLLFLFFRFMSGIGVGAAMPVVFSYFTEFLSRDRRGPMIGVLASFWMVGNILTAGIAWLVIPKLQLGSAVGSIWYGSWRIFVALCAVPSLSSAIFIFIMPESPKYLQKIEKFDEAADVLKMIHQMNNKNKENEIPDEIFRFSTYCLNASVSKVEESKDHENTTCLSGFAKTLKRLWRSTKEIFSKPFVSRSWISVFIWFTLSFGFYGLWMWFPELFQRIQSGESSCSRSAGHAGIHNPMANMTCEDKVVHNNKIYFESFLVALSNLPGNIIMIISVNKIGRRKLLAASMVVCGISAFFFWFVETRAHMIIMSCVFSGLATAGWNALDVLSMELYPTHLRSTAFGIQAAVGRIGAIIANQVFGALVDVHCSVPLFLVAGLLSAGGLTALKLPKTENQALH